ncbi:MAG: hypothetical protein N4A57_05140 [Anaeromicrobium sp.]|jgi:arginine exporter protein ArgO|nr:hypothetical protein [Anaeromicrobium sp.]
MDFFGKVMGLKFAKGIGRLLRFVYGYLKGYIFVSIIYLTVALTIILLDPYEFNLIIVQYIKTPDYSKLNITWGGYIFMSLFGFYEVKKLEKKIKKKKKKRRKKHE